MKEATLHLLIAWDAMKGLVFQTAYKFHWRYGGDLEDTLSEAQELFIHGCNAFDPDRSKLPYYLRYRIWKGLLSRKRRLRKIRMREEPLKDEHSYNDVTSDDWRQGLSSDAIKVCEVVLSPPIDIECILADTPTTKWYRQRAVRQYLLDLGWNKRRIREAFQEIMQHLRASA